MQVKGYNREIDGLRGMAVVFVVLYHFFPEKITGGFIGVDLFFVISGFLITSIILNELKLGSFSVYDFYFRRIQRLFPALVFSIFMTVALGWFILFSDEYKSLGEHVKGSSFFILNHDFIRESGYFDKAAVDKPLLHLWSLSVEVQFYIIWSLFMVVLFNCKLGISKFVFIISIVSFLFCIWLTHRNDVYAFFLQALGFGNFL